MLFKPVLFKCQVYKPKGNHTINYHPCTVGLPYPQAEQKYSRKKKSRKLQKVPFEFAWQIHRVRSYNNLEMINSARKVVHICKHSATLYKRPWPPQIVVSSGRRVSLEPVPSWRQGRLWACFLSALLRLRGSGAPRVARTVLLSQDAPLSVCANSTPSGVTSWAAVSNSLTDLCIQHFKHT